MPLQACFECLKETIELHAAYFCAFCQANVRLFQAGLKGAAFSQPERRRTLWQRVLLNISVKSCTAHIELRTSRECTFKYLRVA